MLLFVLGFAAAAPASKPVRSNVIMLFNLETDRAEQHDVAAQNPEVVNRLKELFAEMDQHAGTPAAGPAEGKANAKRRNL